MTLDYKKILKFEKFFEERFGEDLHVVPLNSKNAKDIRDFDEKLQKEEETLEGFKVEKIKRKTSMFNTKCQHCEKSIIKKQDQLSFIKSGLCFFCELNSEDITKNG